LPYLYYWALIRKHRKCFGACKPFDGYWLRVCSDGQPDRTIVKPGRDFGEPQDIGVVLTKRDVPELIAEHAMPASPKDSSDVVPVAPDKKQTAVVEGLGDE
jgi:hypothetical protein